MKNYDAQAHMMTQHSEALIQIAMIHLLLKRIK